MPGYTYASWDLGYGDFHMVPDLSTLRVATWLDRTAFVLCDLEIHGPKISSPWPRTVLRRQLEAAAESGYTAKGASELEFFLFEDSYREAAEKKYDGMRPAGWYIEDYHLLQGSRGGVLQRAGAPSSLRLGDTGGELQGEWGRGQHEMNIRFTELLDMADRHTMMKQAMKEIADSTGVSITFMAKPDMSEAGSSCHLHVSLWAGETNAFPGDEVFGPVHGSDEFRWFLGGWMAHVPELMVFYAPTINSYKRYQDGSWAPTRLGWSYDNRTAGFRVVGHGESLRIECRIPGADTNPYLAYAAVLASGLDGIANKIEAPEIFLGDVYQAQELPGSRTPCVTPPSCSHRQSSSSRRSGRRCKSTTPISSRRNRRHSTTPSRTGSAGATSSGYERSSQGKVADHRRRLRHRDGDFCSSPPRASVLAVDVNDDSAEETVEKVRAAGVSPPPIGPTSRLPATAKRWWPLRRAPMGAST